MQQEQGLKQGQEQRKEHGHPSDQNLGIAFIKAVRENDVDLVKKLLRLDDAGSATDPSRGEEVRVMVNYAPDDDDVSFACLADWFY